MPTNVAEAIYQEACRLEACRLFSCGAQFAQEALAGRPNCILPARMFFLSVLEWITPRTAPALYRETRQILAEMAALSVLAEEEEE